MNFNSEMWGAVSAIFLAIIGVGSLAVFLSKNANTQGIISSSFSGLGSALAVAEGPVTGYTPPAASTAFNSGAISSTGFSA